MNNEAIKVCAYDLPVKELDLGGGVTKILTAAPDPQLSRPEVSPERSSRDVLSVCLYGAGVRQGSSFAPPRMSYEKLYHLFDDAPEHTYSARTPVFGYRSESGRFISLENLINALYQEGRFSTGEMSEKRPEATVTVSSGGRVSRLLAGQLMDGRRYHYPLLTSEQILSGMNPADSRGEALDAGLLRTGSSPVDYRVIFVMGQRNWNDITEPCFVDFADGGAGIFVEYLPAERVRHNVLHIGPLGGEFDRDISAFSGRGKDTVECSAPAGSLVRFNIDNDDFLNNSRMYYKFTLDGEDCGIPSPEDGFVYNTRIPLYFGGGADYPSGITLPCGRRCMDIKILAHSAALGDSEVDSFKIKIT